ncbi:MAG: hypothetical protein AAFZ49_14470, partial [Cyanobacteria bacterium J06659_2]
YVLVLLDAAWGGVRATRRLFLTDVVKNEERRTKIEKGKGNRNFVCNRKCSRLSRFVLRFSLFNL